MRLQVQEYLESHSLEDLLREHGVYHRVSERNPRKFSLAYDQLVAVDSDPISQECRGLVLMADRQLSPNGPVGSTQVLALPMHRFFNYGQEACRIRLDDPGIRFQEKLDGTLIIVYHDPILNGISIGTRGVPDADVPIDGQGQTFEELFWETWQIVFGCLGPDYDLLEALVKSRTVCFELCTPKNQVCIKYEKPRLWFLTSRDLQTGEESLCPPFWRKNIRAPDEFDLPRDASALAQWVSDRDPAKHEGIVAIDSAGCRAKFKSPGHLALASLIRGVQVSRRRALELVLSGKAQEVLGLLPPAAVSEVLGLEKAVSALCNRLDDEYARVYSPDRKTFAVAVKSGTGQMGVQMARWSGQVGSAREWFMGRMVDGKISTTALDAVLHSLGVDS